MMNLDCCILGFHPDKLSVGEKPVAEVAFCLCVGNSQLIEVQEVRKTHYRAGQACLFGGLGHSQDTLTPTPADSGQHTKTRFSVSISGPTSFLTKTPP
jgi:hypothetical protein